MVGFGYDIHRLEQGIKLILGGIEIESEFGCVAHSDGDVLIHSIIDSLLGACGMGDIGEHFPDTDNQFRGISSILLLKHVLDLIADKYKLVNIDIMIILEKPKLKLFKEQIRDKLVELLSIPPARVNVKAGTNEKLDSIGRGDACAVYTICQVEEL